MIRRRTNKAADVARYENLIDYYIARLTAEQPSMQRHIPSHARLCAERVLRRLDRKGL
jgi:hypothetical protein